MKTQSRWRSIGGWALVAGIIVVSVCLGHARTRDSRLSSVVAIVSESPPMRAFLTKPGVSFVQAYVRFNRDLPDDVIFGLDEEFVEGVAHPVYIKGGDWMAYIGVQRTGAVWVATGTDATMKGQASHDRTWKILDLGQKLRPDTWYRFRTEADFGTRHFRGFSVEGPGLKKSFDLHESTLDYPNYIPFSDRTMSYYVAAMRGRSLMKPGGKPIVFFDDVSGGPVGSSGKDVVAFKSGFEEQRPIGEQPLTVPTIDLHKYEQGRWYLERNDAIFSTMQAPFARSGRYIGVADASID